jgi:hypothetical protein
VVERDLPFECIALVLQGGGALGAYQAGVYEALAEAGIYPDWFAGISIGAINCAIIAGNPPEARIEKLRGFWECITTNPCLSSFEWTNGPTGDAARAWLNQLHAGLAVIAGMAGFFAPRYPPPWLYPSGNVNATSLYGTLQLRDTLERFVVFDRLNAGANRLSVGAFNVRSGNFVYSTPKRTRLAQSISWRAAHCRRVSLRSRSKGSIIGMVAWSPIRHSRVDRRKPASPRHAGFSGRFVKRTRRTTAQLDGGIDASKGHPIFQSHPRRHRLLLAYTAA